ncbi:MAG: hypothetical protein COB09_18835 [Thalassobium sp.]|nr:MAG: hypothetical protein COB09_18835 [Thalassobium sp.]
MSNKKVRVAFGRTVKSNRIRNERLTMGQLYDLFEKPEVREKKDGKYFIFASFSDTKRNVQTVDKYYGATLDLDDTDLSKKEIREVYGKYNCFIYSTHSHMTTQYDEKKKEDVYKGNRYRVVIPYKKPVSNAVHVNAMLSLMVMADAVGTDLSAKALSRPMYLPAFQKKMRKKFYTWRNDQAKLFNAEKIKLTGEQEFLLQELQESITERVDITTKVADGDRNNSLAKIAGKFIHEGMTLEDTMNAVKALNITQFNPPKKDSEVETTVNSIWKSHIRNNGDDDWSGEQILDIVKKTPSILLDDVPHYLKMLAMGEIKGKVTTLEKAAILKGIKKSAGDVTISDLKTECKAISRNIKSDNENGTAILGEGLEKAIDSMREQFDGVFFVAGMNKMVNFHTGIEMKIEAFDRVNNRIRKQGVGQGTPSTILQSIRAIKTVDVMQYVPGYDRVFKTPRGARVLNTYFAPEIEEEKGSVKIMLDHFKYLFPNRKEREIILAFIAYHVQKPGLKFKWMPVIRGNKGIGKSLLADYLIGPLLGEDNLKTLDTTEKVSGRFNDWQTGSQLVVLQELHTGANANKRSELTEHIKSFITDRTVSIERKGIDIQQMPNTTNMLAFTNHDESVYITPDERRFCMFHIKATKKSPAYYDRLVAFFEEELPAIRYYFLNRRLKNINPNSLPVTRYTQKVMMDSQDSESRAILEMVKDKRGIINCHAAFSWSAVCELTGNYKRSANLQKDNDVDIPARNSAQGKRLASALTNAGFEEYGAPGYKMLLDGKRETVFKHKSFKVNSRRKVLMEVKEAKISVDRRMEGEDFE